jgi:hypothetical protein
VAVIKAAALAKAAATSRGLSAHPRAERLAEIRKEVSNFLAGCGDDFLVSRTSG